MGTCSNMRRRMMMGGGGEQTIPDYMCLTALAASTVTVTGSYAYSLEYSLDGRSWNTFDANVTVTLAEGESAFFRGNNTRLASDTSTVTKFVMAGSLAGSGNIMSLLYGKNIAGKTTIPNSYCFAYLFRNCTALTTSPTFPATSLKSYAYYHTFDGCSSLTSCPDLPAVTTTVRCYESMFQTCTSITYCKMLAKTLASYACRAWMYQAKNSASCVFVKNIESTWTDSGQSGVLSNWKIIYYDIAEDKYYLDKNKEQECDDHGNPI